MLAPDNSYYAASTGLSAELQVAAAFAREGAIPCVPLRPARFDLIVEQRGHLFRVQTKRAQWEEARQNARGYHDRAHWRVGLTRRRLPASHPDCFYRADEFDFLAVVCEIDRIYVLPTDLLRSPTDPAHLMRTLHIKPFEGTDARYDAWLGAARWEPYRNRFDLLGPVPTVPPYVKQRRGRYRLTVAPPSA